MNIIVIGGTGLLGYHTVLDGLNKSHSMSALTIQDISLEDWYPPQVQVTYGDVFALPKSELRSLFTGYDAMVYAVGPDDRVIPKAPAYVFFHERLVRACEKAVAAAQEAGVKRCVILGSYFAYFDRIWPDKRLSERHPYIRCRVEQAERAIAAGSGTMDVMILELPYIFGTCPHRVPLWRDTLLDRFIKGRLIFFPKGGTNMVTVTHVGEAVIGALEYGEHGKRYLVGDENHTFKEMLTMMMSAIGAQKKIISIPRFAAVAAGRAIEAQRRRNGLEGGLDTRYLMRDIMSSYLYFDSAPFADALHYGRGGLYEAIEDTMRVSYPELFANRKEIK